MTNALIERAASTGLTALAGANILLDAANKEGASSGSLLRHSGMTGQWTLKGQAVDVGATYAFNVWKVRAQWMAWKSNKPVDQINATLTNGEALPEEADLQDHWGPSRQGTDGWVKNLVFDIVDLNTGEVAECTLKGDAGWRPAWKIVREYGEKVKTHTDANGSPMFAIIEIGDSTFKAKSGQMLHSPTLKIVDWISQEEIDAITMAAEGAEAEAEAEVEAVTAQAPAAQVSQVSARPAPAVRTGRRV